MARLERSLDELRIAMPMSPAALGVVHARDRPPQPGATTASSICRSPAASRGAIMPSRRAGTAPSIVVTARTLDVAGNEAMAADGIAVITVPDNRWERVDIKSVSLLPNVLAKQAAREQGAREAWFVDRRRQRDRRVLEQRLDRDRGRQGGHPAGRSRRSCAASPDRAARRHRGAGPELEERPFTVAEARRRARPS